MVAVSLNVVFGCVVEAESFSILRFAIGVHMSLCVGTGPP